MNLKSGQLFWPTQNPPFRETLFLEGGAFSACALAKGSRRMFDGDESPARKR
jgi:hypothetical protein